MPIDLAAFFDDPRLMFFGFEGDFARFVPMDRGSYARSIFFDQRIEPAEGEALLIPLDPLLDHLAERGFEPPRLRFIHHFAQSGSTLLARALDHPGNLVIREPWHLRQLGVAFGAGAAGPLSADQRAVLEFSLAMLGKRFAARSPLIVKGNVPISLFAGAIAELDPTQAAILLHFPLEDYCAAVLRTPNHQRWLETVTTEIDLGSDPLIGGISRLSVAEKAAALWHSMIKRFEQLLAANPAMRSLDANQLFDRPVKTIAAANQLFDAGLEAAEIGTIASGPLFSSYSKNPAVAYDPATRIERREQTKAMLAADLQLARRWVERRAAEAGLPIALARPLLGEPAPLL
jgi:hypothetical protein